MHNINFKEVKMIEIHLDTVADSRIIYFFNILSVKGVE